MKLKLEQNTVDATTLTPFCLTLNSKSICFFVHFFRQEIGFWPFTVLLCGTSLTHTPNFYVYSDKTCTATFDEAIESTECDQCRIATRYLSVKHIFTPLFSANRFPNQGRQVDDLEIFTHTNETLGSVRRQILQRLKGNPSNVKLELFLNGDLIDTADDRKILLVRSVSSFRLSIHGTLSICYTIWIIIP